MLQPSTPHETLLRDLRRLSLRLRLSDALFFASRSLWLGLTAFALLALLGHFLPLPLWRIWALSPLGFWLGLVVAYPLFRPLPLQRVAQRADSLLLLSERLATAVELHTQKEHGQLDDLQQEDAANVGHQIQPQQIPFQAPSKTLRWSIIPLFVGLALLFLPNPQDAILAERQKIQQTVEKVAKEVAEMKQKVAETKELKAEERVELEKYLTELQEKLRRNAEKQEAALADLSDAEAHLQQKLKPLTDARKAALEQMARNLQNAQNPSDQQANQRPNLDQVAQQLEQLAQQLAKMTPEERQKLADQLNQQAKQMTATDPQTAQNLAAAATALQQGNSEQAAKQLQQVAQNARETQQQVAGQQAVQQALGTIQQGRQQLAQAGQQQAQTGQTGQTGQQGQKAGSGGGSSAQNLGQRQSESKAGVDQNHPVVSDSKGNKRDIIYQPYKASGQKGQTDSVQGQQGQQGQTEVQQGQNELPGTDNASVVPYQQIFPEYNRAAGEALDRSAVPPHLKEYVRSYFSQLEPASAPK